MWRLSIDLVRGLVQGARSHFDTAIDCRVGVHASGAGCRGFESHRRDFDAIHCAVAQPGQSAVNPLTHNFVDRFCTGLSDEA